MLLSRRLANYSLSNPITKSVPARHFSAEKPVTFKLNSSQFKTYKMEGIPSLDAVTTAKELLGYYRMMFLTRRMETALDGLYKNKFIRGFCHLYNGQEAVITGVEAALTRQDHVITAYRNHPFPLFRGDTVKQVMSELTGRVTGSSKGNGGSMHFYRKSGNYYGGHGIVGAQCPLGAGVAFAQAYNKTGQVCATFYGDGAANQGQLYEAFNMASLWKLPVLFICENNLYAMGTSTKRAAAGNTTYYTRAEWIPGLWIDGMDVLAVREGTKFAANYARTNGPIVLEIHTYRYVGHSMSDPGTTYRTRDEVSKVREERDPINAVKKRLLESKLATEEEIKAIETEVRKEVDEATEFAKTAPEPPVENWKKAVYVEENFEPTPVEVPASWEYKY